MSMNFYGKQVQNRIKKTKFHSKKFIANEVGSRVGRPNSSEIFCNGSSDLPEEEKTRKFLQWEIWEGAEYPDMPSKMTKIIMAAESIKCFQLLHRTVGIF